MAKFSHKDAWIEFATVDISGWSNTCEISFDINVSEVTSFSEAWDEYVENTAGWAISVAGHSSQDAGEVEDTLFAVICTGAQAIDYRPQGQTTGYQFQGNAIMKAFKVGGPLKSGCLYSATFQGTGTVTRTAI